MYASPCKNIESTLASSPDACSTIASGCVDPLASSSAPPVDAEFSQPCPLVPLFAHGHVVANDPSPEHSVWIPLAQPRHSAISDAATPQALSNFPPTYRYAPPL